MPISLPEGTHDFDSGTEHSLPRNAAYDSGQTQTTTCTLQVWLDTAALAAGDEFEVRLYEKVLAAGTQRVALGPISLVGAQAEPLILPSVLVGNGWDVTIKRISSTTRTISWSLRRVT